MIRLVFLIRSLSAGGAERQVVTLAKSLDPRRFQVTILTFYAGGDLESELSGSHVRLESLDKRGRWDLLVFGGRLLRRLRRLRPHILHGYLDLANLLALAVKPLFPATRIVWGIRAADVDFARYGWTWRIPFAVQCRLSGKADLIIANSQAAREFHVAHRFPAEKTIVIHNGFDTARFAPDDAAGKRLRAEWNVRPDQTLIGLVARLDPIKDHRTFMRAAALLLEANRANRQRVRFVCVGSGPPAYTQQLQSFAEEMGLNPHLTWTGALSDMTAVYNALDIGTNCSDGESLPNTVGEAMSCGVPCVVTNVGDSAWMVGDCGLVVPPRDPESLAKAWSALLTRDTGEIGVRARARVLERLSVPHLVENTQAALLALRAERNQSTLNESNADP